jgi:hypothetical protein
MDENRGVWLRKRGREMRGEEEGEDGGLIQGKARELFVKKMTYDKC